MKITLQADVLNHIISVVARAARLKSTGINTETIVIAIQKDHIEFIGTDLEIQVVAKLPYKSDKQGQVAVPAQSFAQYLATLEESEKVTLEIQDNYLVVQTKDGSAKFNIIKAENITLFQIPKLQEFTTLDINTVAEIIKKTVFAALKNDDTRPVLTGVYFDGKDKKLTTVALDTFRMSVYDTGVKTIGEHSFVVTQKIMLLLDKVIKDSFLSNILGAEKIEVYIDKDLTTASFVFGDITLYTKLIEGSYPDYRAIIPAENKIQGVVPVLDFGKALRRVGVFAQNSITKEILFTIKEKELQLSSESQENGESVQVIEAKFKGDLPIKIGFQYRFLQDFLNSIDADEMQIKMNNATSPVIFAEKGNKKYTHIIMPLKL